MTWSFSEYRLFRKCPRQWFYKAIFADARAKDPPRHEAYLLSKLQTIHGWRGQIVDAVLGEFVVAELNANRRPQLDETLTRAKALFDAQRDFAMRHKLREPEMSVSKAGSAFAAFVKIEYGEKLEDSEFDQACVDVETAFRNLWKLEELRKRLRDGEYRIAQRNLLFDHCGAKVRAVPDLIVFFVKEPPLLVDWKVHTFGTRDYADQLATYAIAVTRVTPHNDFPSLPRRFQPHELELIEAQLLLGTTRRHLLQPEDVQATEEHIAEGICTLQLAHDGKSADELLPTDFPSAHNPQTCQNCVFRKLCWN
ncbi:MAG: PD-(D/E)XK nuclease family protein [Verrucomicrobia bacterium]|nr:PD-(D/E)XK nuclease family protein [Verrucomicrobiota bacterium]